MLKSLIALMFCVLFMVSTSSVAQEIRLHTARLAEVAFLHEEIEDVLNPGLTYSPSRLEHFSLHPGFQDAISKGELRAYRRDVEQWTTENLRVCSHDSEAKRCLQHDLKRLIYLQKLNKMWNTVSQTRDGILSAIEELPEGGMRVAIGSQRSIDANQLAWEKIHREICIKKNEEACIDSARLRNEVIKNGFFDEVAIFDASYLDSAKDLLDSAVRRLNSIETQYLNSLPRTRRNAALNESRAARRRIEVRCKTRNSGQRLNALTGVSIHSHEELTCKTHGFNDRSILLNEKLANKKIHRVGIPTGCFKWVDGISAFHESPQETYLMNGNLSLEARAEGVNLDLNYTGINGHQCVFSIYAARSGDSYKYKFRIPDHEATCELQIRFSPNFMFLSGIGAQGSCSAYLGCGYSAYLPDAIALTEPETGRRCELPASMEVGSSDK